MAEKCRKDLSSTYKVIQLLLEHKCITLEKPGEMCSNRIKRRMEKCSINLSNTFVSF